MDLSDQRTQIGLIAVLGGLGLIYGWFTYLYTPRNDQISTLEGEVQTLQSDIQTLQLKVARLPRVQADLAEAQQRWQQVLLSFPTEPREDEVIAELSASEQTAGLFIRRWEKGERRGRPLYFEQDWNVQLVGRYSQLRRWITEISGKTRRMTVQRMSLVHPAVGTGGAGAGAGGGPAPQEDELIINCVVTTYVVRTTG